MITFPTTNVSTWKLMIITTKIIYYPLELTNEWQSAVLVFQGLTITEYYTTNLSNKGLEEEKSR